MICDVEYSAHSSRDDNSCKSDAQVNIYLKLLIKTNPVVFLLIEKGLVCTFKSALEEILVSCCLSYSLKGCSCLKCIMFYYLYNFKNVKNTHGGMPLLVKLHTYITHGKIWYKK